MSEDPLTGDAVEQLIREQITRAAEGTWGNRKAATRRQDVEPPRMTASPTDAAVELILKLEKARAAANWSRRHTAQVLGISHGTYNGWVNGLHAPSQRHVRRIDHLCHELSR